MPKWHIWEQPVLGLTTLRRTFKIFSLRPCKIDSAVSGRALGARGWPSCPAPESVLRWCQQVEKKDKEADPQLTDLTAGS